MFEFLDSGSKMEISVQDESEQSYQSNSAFDPVLLTRSLGLLQFGAVTSP